MSVNLQELKKTPFSRWTENTDFSFVIGIGEKNFLETTLFH